MLIEADFIESNHLEALERAYRVADDYDQIILDYDGVIGEASSNHRNPSADIISDEVIELVNELDQITEVYIFSNRSNNGGNLNGLHRILDIKEERLKNSRGNKGIKSSWKDIIQELDENVLVVEDSFSGVLGAERFGYDTIYVKNRNGSYQGSLGFAKEVEDYLGEIFLK